MYTLDDLYLLPDDVAAAPRWAPNVIDRLPHIARYIWGGFTCVGGLRRIPLLCVLRHT
jgi:hypothetical protein